ncbi:MAG: tetratricopeptide repeat protein [Acidobacteriota bacterium]|jgi:tetratricopeptide (TPR) repeat protein|nr:tetratricopeptide repeat protein [Acidobacteriota bacterium]
MPGQPTVLDPKERQGIGKRIAANRGMLRLALWSWGAAMLVLAGVLLYIRHDNPRARLERGKAYAEAGQYRKSFLEFQNILQDNPHSTETHYQLGLLFMRTGRIEEAAKEMQAVVGADWRHWAAQLQLGRLSLLQSEFGRAREKAALLLREIPAGEESPERLAAQILDADACAGVLQHNDSARELREGREAEPQLMAPAALVGTREALLRNAPQAEALYRKAVQEHGRHIPARLALGNLHMLLGRAQEAEQDYKLALALAPRDRDAVYALGHLYLEGGRHDEAEAQFQKYVELNRDEPDRQILLPDFYLSAGKDDRCLQALRKLVADHPENGFFKKRLMAFHFMHRSYDEAGRLADRLIKDSKEAAGDDGVRHRDDQGAAGHFIKGRIAQIRGRGEEAIEHLDASVKKRWNNAEAHYWLGLAYQKAGKPSKALHELENALYIAPSLPGAKLAMAELQLSQRNFKAAAKLARELLDADAGPGEARLILGSALTAQKDYAAAEPELQEFLRLQPDNPAGLLWLGVLAFGQGRGDLAESRLNAVLDNHPANPTALAALTELYILRRRQGEAVARFDQLLHAHPEATWLHGLLGALHRSLGDLPAAEAEYTRAVAAAPGDWDAVSTLAQFYRDSGRMEKEMALLQGYMADDPGNTAVRLRLARVYSERGHLGKALQLLEEVLKLDGNDEETLLLCAQVLMEQSRWREAAAALRTAAAAAPASQEIGYHLGLALLRMGDRAAAGNEWGHAAALDPQYPTLYLALAQLKLEDGDPAAAMAAARQALALDQSSPAAYRILGQALLERHDYANAALALERYVSAPVAPATATDAPGDPAALYSLGVAYAMQGRAEEARTCLESALDAKPQMFEALRALVGIHLRQRAPDKAAGRVHLEMSRDLDNSAYHDLLGQIELYRNDPARAEAEFRKAVALDPENPAYGLSLAAFYEQAGKFAESREILTDLARRHPGDGVIAGRLVDFHLNRGEGGEALAFLDEALRRSPKSAGLRLLKATVYQRQGKAQDALRETKAAVKDAPGSAEARYLLGVALHREKADALAEIEWRTAVRNDARHVPARLGLAQLALAAGRCDEAIRHGRAALDVRADALEARTIVGGCLVEQRRYREAAEALAPYVQARPNDAWGLYLTGVARLGLGESEKARALLEEALAAAPDNLMPLKALTDLDLSQGRPEQALARIEGFLRGDPRSAGRLELLGSVHLSRKDYAKAEAAFARASAANPRLWSARLSLAKAHIAQRHYREALAELRAVLGAEPRSVEAHLLIASAYGAVRNHAQAQAHYREALKIDPDQPDAANNLAWSLAQTGGDLKEAAALAKRAHEKLPESPTVWDTLGWVYHRQGREGKAIALLERCVAAAPENASYHYHLGMAYRRRGEGGDAMAAEEAERLLARALELDPRLPIGGIL